MIGQRVLLRPYTQERKKKTRWLPFSNFRFYLPFMGDHYILTLRDSRNLTFLFYFLTPFYTPLN